MVTREIVQVPEGTVNPYNAAKTLAERQFDGVVIFVYRLGPTCFAVSIRA